MLSRPYTTDEEFIEHGDLVKKLHSHFLKEMFPGGIDDALERDWTNYFNPHRVHAALKKTIREMKFTNEKEKRIALSFLDLYLGCYITNRGNFILVENELEEHLFSLMQ